MRDGQSAPVTHLRRCRGESVARHRVPQPLGRAATPVTGGAGRRAPYCPPSAPRAVAAFLLRPSLRKLRVMACDEDPGELADHVTHLEG
jgi:hypothetical protein